MRLIIKALLYGNPSNFRTAKHIVEFIVDDCGASDAPSPSEVSATIKRSYISSFVETRKNNSWVREYRIKMAPDGSLPFNPQFFGLEPVKENFNTLPHPRKKRGEKNA